MTAVHHLSHIDLDGYGAQFVGKEFFKNIVFYNANYGREVEVRLRDMLSKIKSAENTSFLILITDLNLTLNEAKFLQSEVALLNAQGKKAKILRISVPNLPNPARFYAIQRSAKVCKNLSI